MNAVPDLAARGGGRVAQIFPEGAAHAELAGVQKLGARYLVLGQGLYRGFSPRPTMRRHC